MCNVYTGSLNYTVFYIGMGLMNFNIEVEVETDGRFMAEVVNAWSAGLWAE